MAKLKPGDKIGPFPYQIVKQLGKGQGNMSDVYLATEGSRPDSPLVVLKISRASSEHGDFFTDTILNESDRLKKLSHPGIARLLPIKTNNASMRNVPYVANASLEGRPWFLVLEHLAGGSLDELLNKEKRIPQVLALRVAQRLAATLDYIHRCGQVHLDIKPENILFRRELAPDALPDPVLIDFGIARDIGQEGLEARTLHYSPPERVLIHKSNLPMEALNLAKPAPSMDVYSLGIVLYQMLTGRRPFEGQNDKRISSAILQGNPTRPSVYVGGLDSEIEDLVLQAMAKDPAARPIAGEMAQRLEAIAVRKVYGEDALDAEPAKSGKKAAGGRKRRSHVGLLIAGAAVLATLALGLVVVEANGGLPPLFSPPGPTDEGGGSGGGWWDQLMAFLPGAEGANGGAPPILWVTPTVTAAAPDATSVALAPTSTPVPPRPTVTATSEPTSTPVRPTDTPRPTATATSLPTSIPVGGRDSGAALIVAAVEASTVTATATASATPPPPTSTPAVRIGAGAAAKTTAPTKVPPAAAGTSVGLSTPVARRTNTPTPRPAAPTPTAAPAAPATAVQATPAPLDLSQAKVRLLEPADGYSGRGSITFRWETAYPLAANQAFEAVFWRAGGDPMRDGRGYGGATRGGSVTINWDALGVAQDGYQWGVLLVETDPYKRIHYMGGGNGFQFTGPDNPDSDGNDSGPPTK